jgi:alpha-maltose-1-phosphate synthase
MTKPKIAIVRGAFLNKYEMQFYEPLTEHFDITAFSSLKPFQDQFKFKVVKLPCPMDLPDFPGKMLILNRIFIDAHYLLGLEEKLKGFDLVHSAETYYRYTQQSLNAKKKGYVKKVVATVLENIAFNNEGIWGRKGYKARARNELDHMIALTKKTQEVLIHEGADEQKISIISHFIDTNRFKPTKLSQAKIANQELQNINLLFCGRLEVYKGVYDILEAFKLLNQDQDLHDYYLTLTFVGKGNEYQKMLNLENSLKFKDRIIHLNTTYDQMPEIYQTAQIYLAPSQETNTWVEQYNTTLLEAQASGLPIITTKSGGIPENVGDAAILVKPGDINAIYKELKALILNPKLRIYYGNLARARAIKVHDIKFGSQKLTKLYESLLK